MPRLIDDLRRKDAHIAMPWFVAPDNQEKWKEIVLRLSGVLNNRQLPVLLIDNVSDYYYTASDQERWDISRDFPNLAPPYPLFWCEHKLPRRIHSKEKGDSDMSFMQGRCGFLVAATDRPDFVGSDIPDNVHWILWVEIVIDYGMRGITAFAGHGHIFIAVDANGAVVEAPWMQSLADPKENAMMASLMTWLNPMLLAISFLHCKNVRVDDNHVPKPLAKKYKAKTGVDPTPYKTLVIEPLKQILRHEGRSGEHGLAKAMHICRGHFRDYREGRGLFGKYKQLVWMPSLIRGTKGKEAPPREMKVKV